MIRFSCPDCGKSLRVEDEFAGRRAQCPKCKRKMRVPAIEDETIALLKEDIAPPLNVIMPSQAKPSEAEEGLDELELLPVDGEVDAAFEMGDMDDGQMSMLLTDAAASETSGQHDELAQLPVAPNPGKNRFIAEAGKKIKPSRSLAGAKAGMQLVGGLIGAGVGASLGAIAWAVIGGMSGYEVGIVAWGVGLLAGLGATIGSRSNGTSIAMIAVAMAILGVMIGKAAMASTVSTSDIDELLGNPDAMAGFMVTDMIKQSNLSPGLQAEYEMYIDSEDDEVSPELEQLFITAHNKFDGLSQQQRRDFARRIVTEFVDDISFSQKLKATLSPYDFLWCILAISTAWKIGVGADEE